MLKRPLGVCICFSISAVLRLVYISRTMLILPLGTCIEIATGRWACGFILLETVLILPVGVEYVSRLWPYSDSHWAYKFILNVTINIATGQRCSCIDRNRIEIATRCISLCFLGLYQCCHKAYVYKYWLIRHWLPSFFSTGLQLPWTVTVKQLQSLSHNCYWTLIIVITIIELFEPAPNNFH